MTTESDLPPDPADGLNDKNFFFQWIIELYHFTLKIRNNYEEYIEVDDDYTISPDECFIGVDCTAGNKTATYPSQADIPNGKKVIIKKTDVSANTLAQASPDSATFKTSRTTPLPNQNDTIVCIADGTDWHCY